VFWRQIDSGVLGHEHRRCIGAGVCFSCPLFPLSLYSCLVYLNRRITPRDGGNSNADKVDRMHS
jgi:hypothetical protein